MSSINFVLTAFETSVTLDICGNLYAESTPALDVSATALTYVDLNWMKQIFRYRTDAIDVIDASLSDIMYFVFSNKWDTNVDVASDATNYLNPANAMLSTSALPTGYVSNEISSSDAMGNTYASNKRMVCHDFTRYLAQQLFNTPYGVDLFNNEVNLLKDIRTICGNSSSTGALKQISNKLYEIDASNSLNHTATVVDPVSGYHCLTNLDIGPTNICRTLMAQMVAHDPARFSNIQLDTEIDAYNIRDLPFMDGDTVEFKLIIAPAENQHLLTDVSPIDARSYRIIWKLTSQLGTSPNINVEVDPLETI